MTSDKVKKAYESAEKELEQEEIQKIKDLVKSTLQKIKQLDDQITDKKKELKEIEEDKKILRMDLDDLKEGHIERIEERQAKDERAKKVSVFRVVPIEQVIKEIHHYHHDEHWYRPFQIFPQPIKPWYDNIVYCDSIGSSGGALTPLALSDSRSEAVNASFTMTNSLAKNNVIGTYDICGTVINFR